MATEGGGKIKPKRGHSSSKPYERRKSLLGKVTDTVKDLLAPSWLTDFVSNVSKKTPPKERKDVLIEEEEDIFMSPAQSPSQLNCVKKTGNLQAAPLRTVTASAPNAVQSTSHGHTQPAFSSSHLPFSKFTSQKTRLQNDDAVSERSDASTSGCSSMIPHPDKQAYQREILQLNDSALEMLKSDFQTTQAFQSRSNVLEKSPQSRMTSTTSMEPKKSDIAPNPLRTWSSDKSRQGRPLAPAVRDQPSFNTSLFGSPVLNQSSILGGSFGESSFYSGKTTYGGASAYRKLNNTAPYQTALPIRKQLKAKPHNNSLNAVTSSTARRILETLERMSTPLTDAKKIPSNESYITDSVLSFTPGSYRRRPSRSIVGSGSMRRSLEVPVKGPPTNQLKTPSIASISKNRQKSLISTPTTSRVPEMSQSTSQEDCMGEDDDASNEDEPIVIEERPAGGRGKGGKMKRDKSYHTRRPLEADDDDDIEMPSLRTDFTLPVAKLPAFNFTSTSTESKSKKVTELGKDDNVAGLKFTFSSPIPKSSPSSESVSGKTTGFKFSSPIRVSDKTPTSSEDSSPSFKPIMNSSTAAPMSKLGNGGIGMNFKTNEKSSPVEIGKPASKLKQGSVMEALGGSAFKPSSDLKKGSVMDVLGGSAVKPPRDLKQGSVMDVLGGSAFKPSSDLRAGSVMDVLNKDSKTPAKTSTFASTSPSKDEGGLGKSKDSFGVQPASQLKQGSVMDILGKSQLKESSSSVKPAADLKGGSVMDILGKKATTSPATDDLLSKFRKPADEWDCDTCLVRNKAAKTKCVACGTSKPGSTPQPPLPVTSSSTSNDLLAKFKTPAGSWICDACLVQNKPDATKCVACTTKKPGSGTNPPSASGGSISTGQPSLASVFKAAAGSWSCDTCLVSNKAEDVKCVACLSIKPGASAPAEKSTSSNSTSGFGSGFSFGGAPMSGPQSFTIPGGFSFGKPASEKDSEPAGGGFKLGTGFNFGAPAPKTNDLKPSPNGDASAAGSAQSDEKSTPGLSHTGPVSDTPKVQTETATISDTRVSGNLFSGLSSTASKSSDEKDNSTGGFVFGQKTEPISENKEGVKSGGNSSGIPGGFSFGQNNATPAASGLVFGTPATSKVDVPKAESSGVTGGFSIAAQDPVKLNSAPVFGSGSAAAGTDSATAAKPAANSLFAFGQPVVNADTSKPLGAGGGFAFSATGDGGSTKRTRDSDTDSAPAKKAFTFGQNTAAAAAPTTGFNFAASTSVTTPSNVFSFGAASGNSEKPTVPSGFSFGMTNTTTASDAGASATSAKPAFAFGSSQSGSGTPFQFSAQPAAAAATTTTTAASSLFQFGGSSGMSQSGFAFKSTPATTTTTSSAPFGSGNALPQPVFGNTANSTPQMGGMFGNAGSSFGANNSATSAPSFGSADQNVNQGGFGGFKMGSSGSQSAGSLNSAGSGFNFGGSAGVFQFGAKSNEASAGAPVQGSASAGFAFGSTQQPQPAAPAPSFNSSNSFGSFTGTAGFTIGSNPESGRKIRKAVRKIRK